MNELNKLCSIKRVVSELVKEKAEAQDYYCCLLASEIEFSTKDEIWMALCILKDKDKTPGFEVLKSLIMKVVANKRAATSQHYKVFLGIVEELPDSAEIVASLLLEQEESVLVKETRKYLKSKDETSMEVLSCIAKKVAVSSPVFGALVALLPYYYNVHKIQSVQLIGGILSRLSSSGMISALASFYKREHLYGAICMAALACSALDVGLCSAVGAAKDHLLGKDARQSLKKLNRHRGFYVSLYVLAMGLLYCSGDIGSAFIEELAVLHGACVWPGIFPSLEKVFRMAAGPKKESIGRAAVRIVAKRGQVCGHALAIIKELDASLVDVETAASLIEVLLLSREGGALDVAQAWMRSAGLQEAFSRRILSEEKPSAYFHTVEPDFLSEREQAIYCSRLLDAVLAAAPEELSRLVQKAHTLSICAKQKVVEALEARLDRASEKSKQVLFAEKMAEIVEMERLPRLLRIDTEKTKKCIEQHYRILKAQNTPEKIALHEIQQSIKRDREFKKGTKLFYWGVHMFPQEMKHAYMGVHMAICESIARREVKDYTYSFRILRCGIEKEVAPDARYCGIFTNEVAMWLYREKELVVSLNSYLEALCAYSEKYLIACTGSIEHIRRHSTVRCTIMSCNTALHNLQVLQAQNAASEQAGVPQCAQEAKRMPNITDRILLCVMHVMEAHQDASLLSVLSAGAASSASFSAKDRHGLFKYVIQRLQHTQPRILAALLSIYPDGWKDVLAFTERAPPALTADYLTMTEMLLLLCKEPHKLARRIERLDEKYSSMIKLERNTHKQYISLKTAEARLCSTAAERTVEAILKKIERDGVEKELFASVAGLFASTCMDPERIQEEIKRRVNRKTAPFFLPILYKMQGPQEVPEMVNIPLADSLRPAVKTEVVQLLRQEESVLINSSRYMLVQEHAEQLGAARNPKGIMLFFLKESPSPLLAAFANSAEASPELLLDLFPIALDTALREMPRTLKRNMLGALGEVALLLDSTQKMKGVLQEGIEYVIRESMGSLEIEHMLKYIAPERRYLYAGNLAPAENIAKLKYLQKHDPEEADIFQMYLKNNDSDAGPLADCSEEALKEACMLGSLEKAVSAAASLLSTWDAPHVPELLAVYRSSAAGMLRAVGALNLSLTHELHGKITPGWLRIMAKTNKVAESVLKSTRKLPEEQRGADLSVQRTCQEYKQRIGNEILAAAIQPCSLLSPFIPQRKLPLEGLLRRAVELRDARLVRLFMEAESGESLQYCARVVAKACTDSYGSADECNAALDTFLCGFADAGLAGAIEKERRSALARWGKLRIAKAGLKEKVEILKEIVACGNERDDAVMLLRVINDIPPEEEAPCGIEEVIETINPLHLFESMHEVARLESMHPKYALLAMKRMISCSPGWGVFTWAVHRSGPPAGSPLAVCAAMQAGKEYADAMQEIAQTPGEFLLGKLPHLKLREKRYARPEAPTLRQAGLENPRKDAECRNLSACLGSLLEKNKGLLKTPKYREKTASDSMVKKAYAEMQDFAEAPQKTEAWKILCRNRIGVLVNMLLQTREAKIVLNKRAKRIFADGYLPGEGTKIFKVEKSVPIVYSLKSPRIIKFTGEDGICREYLVKLEKDAEVERAVARMSRVLGALVPDAYEILRGSILVAKYVCNSQSLKECILEIRRDKEAERGIKGRSLERREREEVRKLCANYNDLKEAEKLEIYRKVTDFTAKEIAHWICKHTPTVHSYMERARQFSRTYLYNSLVAYALGVGDRHPGNILILSDASAMHIDYVDAFDTLSMRTKYQERVPMRLTPMILSAIGPDAMERLVCVGMRIFRQYREDFVLIESMLALLFSKRAHFRKLTHEDVCAEIGRKLGVPQFEREAALKDIYRRATSIEAISQMYFGWMPFW
ncbi:uncharacterized protein NEMAJ01_0433 [Nematocida major]|uniref:uncharacterized protein n=1 Tax=Nematocida major TaxID=1912982 RepID=UPI002008C78F|nr:uncharacterized protein NEMAJ01_0433 [Nematocida major]KAH9385537.1 hypothetical protein NEMAJ01_0433 [Nematocida major]